MGRGIFSNFTGYCWPPLFHCLLLVCSKYEVVAALEALSVRKVKGLLPGLVWSLPIVDWEELWDCVEEALCGTHSVQEQQSLFWGGSISA